MLHKHLKVKTVISLRINSCAPHLLVSVSSQVSLFTTYCRKFKVDDSRLLKYLTQRRFQDARKLLDIFPARDEHGRVVHWTSLLTKYSKTGWVEEARILFDIMPQRNIVTYNAMLSGYVQYGMLAEACQFFKEMPERNVVSWTSMISGLADMGRIHEAKKLFNEMPEKNVVSWNSMIVGLIRNGDLEEARLLFDQMPMKDTVSWNTMIAGYAENCRMEEARILFDGMLERNVISWTSVISGYCWSGNVDEAYFLFQRMPERNVVSWTAMIDGFARNGFYEEALLLFLELRKSSDVKPNRETFVPLAYACTGMELISLGKQLHAHLFVNGWDHDDYDGKLSKSLVHMYSTFGYMDLAYLIFSQNSGNFDIQSFNHMINGYIQIGQLESAQNLFDKVPIRDKISWTSMIGEYISIGEVSKACHLFQNMPEKDAVAWTTMISGHVRNELLDEAINLFSEMRTQGVVPLNSTYSVLLGAMGAVAYLDSGRKLHGLLIKTEHKHDLILNNSLISMYAKCGEINHACSIFSHMASRDLVSWNSMIMGFSDHGLSNEALKIFESMMESRTLPNSVTFLGILSACSHAGLVGRGWEMFNAMSDVYSIKPGLEHYICMISLLGRAGRVNEAHELILRLPFEPGHAVWGALLGMCGLGQRNAEIARYAAMRLLEIDPLNASAHVALCNIFAANGQYVAEKTLRREMGLKGVRKVPGCSWVLVKGRVHVFLSGNKLQPEVYDMLLHLFKTLYESHNEGNEACNVELW